LKELKSISVDPVEYFIIFLARYPILSNSLFAVNDNGTPIRKISAFTLADGNGIGAVMNYWINTIPYLYLLQVYLNDLFSPTGVLPALEASTAAGASVSSSALVVSNNQQQQSLMERYRSLMLELIIAYWIDVITVVRKDHQNVVHYRRAGRSGNQIEGVASFGEINDYSHSHDQNRNSRSQYPSPLDLVLLDSISVKWTIPTCQVCCLSFLFLILCLFLCTLMMARVCFCFFFIYKKEMQV
jgi:hypothetical protein